MSHIKDFLKNLEGEGGDMEAMAEKSDPHSKGKKEQKKAIEKKASSHKCPHCGKDIDMSEVID